jgi:DNA sulfur modification protein DndD
VEILEIILNNWQGYYGSKEESTVINIQGLNGKKNLIVYGQNTHGKTALWQGIQYAFYGRVNKRKTGWEDGKYKIHVHPESGKEPLLNTTAYKEKDYSFSIQLKFEHNDSSYQLIRSHVVKENIGIPRQNTHMKPSFSIRNLETNDFVSEPEKFIQNILPERLAQFFMFDGERLKQYKELFEEDKDVKLKEYIQHVLRMPILVDGVDDLSSLESTAERTERKCILARNNNQGYIAEYEEIDAEREEIEEAIGIRKDILQKLNDRLEEVDTWLSNNDEAAVAQAQEIEYNKQKEDLDKAEVILKNRMKKELPNSWRAILTPRLRVRLKELDKEILRQEKENRKIGILLSENKSITNQLEGNPCITCGHIHQNLSVSQTDKLQMTIIKNKGLISSLEETRIDPNPAYLRKRQTALQNICTDLNLDNLLNLQNDLLLNRSNYRRNNQLLLKALEKLTVSARGKVQKYAKEKLDLTKDIGANEADQDSDNFELKKIKTNLRNLSEKMGGSKGEKTLEHRKIERKLEIIRSLREIWARVTETHSEDMRSSVEDTASKVFMGLTNMHMKYERLSINQSFVVKIIAKDGSEDAGSEGQSSLVAYSILDSLTRLSDITFPFIIDTPSVSIDDDHLMKLITYLFDTDRQVFLFPEGKELKPDIGDKKFGSTCAATYEIELYGETNEKSRVIPRIKNFKAN